MTHDRLQHTTAMPPAAVPHSNRPRRINKMVGLNFGVSIIALGVALGVTLGISLSMPGSAAAQSNLIVDLTDPNVSVDLSVLNDGGLAPQMGAPMTGAQPAMDYSGAAFQEPGKDTPVSTLYIKPSSGFKLPPQTKPIDGVFAKAPAPDEPEDAMPAPVEVAETPAPPPSPMEPAPTLAPEPAPAPQAAVSAPTAPAAPEPAEEVAALAPPPPAEQSPTEQSPAPVPAPATTSPAPEVAPEAAQDTAPMALSTTPQTNSVPPMPPVAAAPAPITAQEQAPAQAPAALTPPPVEQAIPTAPAPQERDEAQTAPMPPKASGVIIPLPPREEPAAEVASLPPATGPLSDGDSLRIVFDAETSKLPQAARDSLLDMANKMRSQDNLRLQLLAYAGNADTSASAARRLSLSRALAVRSFLIENGVRSTRIDVRALGNKSTDEVTERVDITVVER